MPILFGDVKLLKSAVMADVPEGGGAPTGQQIADGISNAVFPDISEMDRAGGRVALRKVFARVETDDTDTYFGANLIVAEPPADPRVSVTLFKAKDSFELRSSAQGRMESYLFIGANLPGYLLEDHIAGQRVVQLFLRPEWDTPPVGAALVLEQNKGLPTAREQYVRVTKASSVVRQFMSAGGASGAKPYFAKVVSLELSDPLRFDFSGSPPTEEFRPAVGMAKVHETVVADAGAYVGCVPLAQAAALGAFGVRGQSVYTQLVPSQQTEVPMPAQIPHAAAALPMQSGTPTQVTTSAAWSAAAALQLPGGALPASVQVQVDGITIADAAGKLKTASGVMGTIDYANGVLTLDNGTLSGIKTITYTPAAQLLRAPQSTCIDVTPESRSLSYVGFIQPVPQRATTSISYMAQGRWYVLQDYGDGQFKGLDSAYGAGTINADTGSFVVTLGALPDVGSAIVIQWGVPTQETRHPAATLSASQRLQLTPAYGQAVQPGTMSLTWPKKDGTTATANVGADGVLAGDATGRLWTGSDAVDFVPHAMPPIGAQINVAYVTGPKQIDDFTHPSRNGQGKLAVTASLGAVTPGSLEVRWPTLTDEAALSTYTQEQLKNMGVGVRVDPTQYARDDAGGALWLGAVRVGTVDYVTGTVVFAPDTVIKIPVPQYSSSLIAATGKFKLNYEGIAYIDAPSIYPNDESGWVKLLYNAPGATSAQQETIDFAPEIALVPDVKAAVVPGSATLGVGRMIAYGLTDGPLPLPPSGPLPLLSEVWQDSGNGVLRQRTDDGTGWIVRGNINYITATVQLSSWTPGELNQFQRRGCVTTAGEPINSEYVFRTASAPLRPGSLSVQFARASGGVQTITVPATGELVSAGVLANVNHDTGLVKLRFGTRVVAAGNEAEPWFDETALDVQGKIFRPEPVAVSTVRYSAVAYSYLPLDASLLGIDPVRLPSDGRVPIFRAGGFAVVGHTGRLTATVSAGQTLNAGRVRLSRLRVLGNDGVAIHTGTRPTWTRAPSLFLVSAATRSR